VCAVGCVGVEGLGGFLAESLRNGFVGGAGGVVVAGGRLCGGCGLLGFGGGCGGLFRRRSDGGYIVEYP